MKGEPKSIPRSYYKWTIATKPLQSHERCFLIFNLFVSGKQFIFSLIYFDDIQTINTVITVFFSIVAPTSQVWLLLKPWEYFLVQIGNLVTIVLGSNGNCKHQKNFFIHFKIHFFAKDISSKTIWKNKKFEKTQILCFLYFVKFKI